jgi:hypothetical protein
MELTATLVIPQFGINRPRVAAAESGINATLRFQTLQSNRIHRWQQSATTFPGVVIKMGSAGVKKK